MQDIRKALYVGSRSDGTLIQRPMSPHLQVYRYRLSMVLSISNRITGVIATAGAALGVCWLGAAAKGPKAYATARKVTGNPLGQLVLVGWLASVVYHTVGGIRHLIWDAGYRYDKEELNKDGPVAVGVTAGVSTVLAVALLAVAGCRRSKRAKAGKVS
ncbi:MULTISPECIES: succinate dehydrogenase, cytochrome b556 subunit [Acetobacter]|jgi:succinate dehydrogenase / fumarate reductase cytochrome b subunit|uniref:Succinate dehydrogenase cytochrome b556 subunit n=1 Tax=Acetobacter lovaniensis TaxID=104100 RepID=A0A841QI12_9PROT|nr:succinate dehydrogenase, cytochrome b556 subunit [Acetobacter lovaniensis]MBB6457652.1 succinate dehydrogenase / fumarate reductase cytochrome b subunit [Acetobacter lovaniensis]MCP1239989.1 succinate dehydrogenase, cytochrome b556 subunit [Acetobacter lovaniensis]NHN81936.1 succinate dehydrogenase, cytochrome b556 subunit [Acetobacter lovaniensis]GBQ64565.1 succinate dehydrogenase cytochrome b subunit [Acetobacter lovaniensis NRIC 0474]